MGIVLTHSAKYKPMSFERLIQPYVMATEEYRTLEKGIADLDAEAESMRQIAQREIDIANKEGRAPKSFATDYMNYADSLDTKAMELANKGLKGVNRKALYDLQVQYKTKVKPIEDADKYIKEIAKEQRLLNKSGNIVFDRDFSNEVSIQDVIDNPSLGYNAYNLDDYGKQAILEGTAIKAGMTPTYLGKDHTNQNIFYSQGMSDKNLYNWLAGTPNEELDATVDRIAGNAPQAVKDRVKSDLAKSLRATISKETNKDFISKPTKIELNSRGLDSEGNINKNSDYWKTQGISWNADGTINHNGKKKTVHNLGKGNILIMDSNGDYEIKKIDGWSTENNNKGKGLGQGKFSKIAGNELPEKYSGTEGVPLNMEELNNLILDENDTDLGIYESIINSKAVKNSIKEYYKAKGESFKSKDIDAKWKNLSDKEKLNYLKLFIENKTSQHDMSRHTIYWDYENEILGYKEDSMKDVEEVPGSFNENGLMINQ